MVWPGIFNNKEIFTSITNTLYPSICALCGESGQDNLDLCNGCYADLPHCIDVHHKKSNLPYLDRCITPLYYATIAAYLIKGLKFQKKLAYGRILSNILARCLAKNFDLTPIPHCIIPVPLHYQRLKARGFNQAQEIAQIPARMLQLPIETKTCIRVLATKPQTELTRNERIQNLHGAFVVTGKVPICVALVDDVITTGSTINELAQALKIAGVQYIHAWAASSVGD